MKKRKDKSVAFIPKTETPLEYLCNRPVIHSLGVMACLLILIALS